MATAARKTQAPPTIGERIRQYNEITRIQREQLDALMPDGLTAFVAAAFDGDNLLVNVGAAPSWQEAEQAILAAIDAQLATPLNEAQRSRVGMRVVMYWNRREQLAAAEAVETRYRHAEFLDSMAGA